MAKHLLITGRVQGVGYRDSMCYEAERLGVTGWVRNLRSGAVEAMVDGDTEALAAIVSWARTGPRSARVEAVDVEESGGTFTRFERLPTA